MKKLLLTFATAMMSIILFAQTPEQFNFQAVLRSDDGNPLENQPTTLVVTFSHVSNGTGIYQESHSVTTDDFGLLQLRLGSGTVLAGAFQNINWQGGSVFVRGQATAGNVVITLPEQRLSSVPYALHAKRAEALTGPNDIDNTNELQTLSLTGTSLSISGTNSSVNLSALAVDNDAQTLSVNGNSVAISGGNSVDLTFLKDDNDANPTNELQNLSFSGTTLTLSGTNSQVNLSSINTDTQTLSVNGNSVAISSGNSIDLTFLKDDADANPTNELQNLSFSGTTLTLSGTNSQVNLSSLATDNDAQTLSFNGTTLSIANGNNVDLAALEDDADASPTNEIQHLELIGGSTLKVTGSNSQVNLAPFVGVNTDGQILELNGNNLSITNGNQVDLNAVDNQSLQEAYNNGSTIQLAGSNEFRVNKTDGSVLLTTHQGNVGIGTSSASATLDIRSAAADQAANLQIANPDQSHMLYFFPGREGDPNPFISVSPTDPLRFASYDGFDFSQRMIIDAQGNLGLGVTDPVHRVQIEGQTSEITASEMNVLETGIGATFESGTYSRFIESNATSHINVGATTVIEGSDNNYAVLNFAKGTGTNRGSYSAASGGANQNTGAVGVSFGSSVENMGVRGAASGGTTQNIGGYFQGAGASPINFGSWGAASGAVENRAVYGVASGTGNLKYGLYGLASGANTNYGAYTSASGGTIQNYGGSFSADGPASQGNFGLRATASGAPLNYGLWSLCEGASTTNYGMFTTASGGSTSNFGVRAVAEGVSLENVGVSSRATGGTNENYGGAFRAEGASATNIALWGRGSGATINYAGYFITQNAATTNYGIYAAASGATTNFAGFFQGRVDVNGPFNVQGQSQLNGNVNVSGNLSVTGSLGNEVRIGNVRINDRSQHNLSVGQSSMDNPFTGTGNTALGAFTLNNIVSGVNNTALGYRAMDFFQNGENNVAIGPLALFEAVNSSDNVAVGRQSGMNIDTDDNFNVMLGTFADINNDATIQRAVAIGYNAKVGQSDAIILGQTSAAVRVGIGTTTPNEKLDVAGNVLVTGTVTATNVANPSDIRLKKDITPITNALERLLQVDGMSYYWKNEEIANNTRQYGVIAQELEKVLPDLVATDKNGMKSVNYMALIPFLVEALKEQQDQISQLQSENAALSISLNKRVDELTSLVMRLAKTDATPSTTESEK